MTTFEGPRLAVPDRTALQRFLERADVQRAVLVLVVLNAVVLGLETSDTLVARHGAWLQLLDQALLAAFVLEIGLRLVAWRGAFFRDPWSVFDFAVVAIALVPASGPFAVLRALRVLRVLRVLTLVPSMRRVVGGLLAALPGLGSIAMVLLLVYYVFGVIATQVFGDRFPDWFGTLGRSLYTLFQVMTLESWSMGIVRPLMEVFPYAWTFFIPFILVATFTMLNLFIGVIVSAMQGFATADVAAADAAHTGAGAAGAVQDARAPAESDLHAEMHTELRVLRTELAELKDLLRAQAQR